MARGWDAAALHCTSIISHCPMLMFAQSNVTTHSMHAPALSRTHTQLRVDDGLAWEEAAAGRDARRAELVAAGVPPDRVARVGGA